MLHKTPFGNLPGFGHLLFKGGERDMSKTASELALEAKCNRLRAELKAMKLVLAIQCENLREVARERDLALGKGVS